jgi:hypothetical protein
MAIFTRNSGADETPSFTAPLASLSTAIEAGQQLKWKSTAPGPEERQPKTKYS